MPFSRQDELTGFKSWLHRHPPPPHRPHHPHRYTAPLTALILTPMCAQTPSAPTALTTLPHCPHRSPPSLLCHCPHLAALGSGLCHCPHLAALGSGFQVFQKYLEASNVCPTAFSASSTPTALSASPATLRRHQPPSFSAIVPTWSLLVGVFKSLRSI